MIPVQVSATTRLAGVTGWPLGHTLSPVMHNAAYEAMGLDWIYVPLPVERSDDLGRLADAMRVLPFVGLNVTMPHKAKFAELCDEVAPLAEAVGAVNVIQVVGGRLVGHNTDGQGLIDALADEGGVSLDGRKVVLIGAGGAAASALAAIAGEGAASVAVVNRSVGNAERMLERLSGLMSRTRATAVPLGSEARDWVEAADVIVNAPPVGLKPEDGSPLPGDWLHEGQIAADMIYSPAVTPLLAQALAAGATAVGGLGMLVAQGARSIEIWSGRPGSAPRDVMRRAAESSAASSG